MRLSFINLLILFHSIAFSQNRAIIVGYPDSDLFSLEDMSHMGSYLANQDFDIHLITAKTIDKIEEEYNRYFKRAHDTIIYYHTSHGVSEDDKKAAYRAMKLTREYEPPRNEYSEEGLVNGSDMIYYEDLFQLISKLRYKYLLVIIDACYAGSAEKYLADLPDVGYMLSSSEDEESFTECHISAFTKYLISHDDIFNVSQQPVQSSKDGQIMNPIIKY